MRLKSDEFIALYNELDRHMRKYLKTNDEESHTSLIKRTAEKNRIFGRYKDELISFARLRNAIVHNPYKRDAEPIAEPHDFVLKEYARIKENVINPPLALNTIAIKAGSIYTTTLDSIALDVMKKMSEEIYTHVPVIENSKLVGVFSEDTVFSYVVKNEDIIIEKDVKIKEFADFIPIHEHRSEIFRFVPKNTPVILVEDEFQKVFSEGKRLAVIFITETGKETEKILGMITAWDLIAYKS